MNFPLLLHEACARLKIEPARARFLEMEFRGWIGAQGEWLDESAANRLRRAHELVFTNGRSLEEARRELATGAGAGIIAVTSGKGGVGKTTFSVNLAASLASRGRSTLLIDADLGLGNVHVFAGVSPRGTLVDVVDRRMRLLDALVPGPGGAMILCGGSGVTRMADLDGLALHRLACQLNEVAADFDAIILDTGAGISSAVLHFLRLAHEIVVVSTPSIAATLDAYGVIKAAREAGVAAPMGIVVNLVTDGAQASDVHARIAGCAQRFLGFSPIMLGALLRDDMVERCNQARQPIVLAQPQHPNARRLADIASRLVPLPTPNTAAA